MKNIAIICMGIFALCFVGCGHDGSGNMPDAPSSLYAPTYQDGSSHLGGLTYAYGQSDDGGWSIDFTDETTYTLTGSALANDYSGNELTGTYTYSNSRSYGTVVLNTGAEVDCTITFFHNLFNRDSSFEYKTTGVRYEGTFNIQCDGETQSGSFSAEEIEFVEAAPTVEVSETAPVSAN